MYEFEYSDVERRFIETSGLVVGNLRMSRCGDVDI